MSIITVALRRPVVARDTGEHGRDDGGHPPVALALVCVSTSLVPTSMGVCVLVTGVVLGGFVIYRVRHGMEVAR